MQSSIRVFKPMVSPRRAVRVRSAILPELQILLHTYVCPAIKECSGIFVGTEEHQQIVLAKLHAISDHYDIAQSEKYVIRALLLDDDKLAVSIADAADIYHKSVDLVRQTISKVPSIHTLPEI
ncbi:hypothetical protein PBCVNEJV1_337R [Paramecium bursaria Chlorella virus NE-JV-1]|nr:hypothetical protein PBCVNEJV1_337R [Paramecium bursaria Chlorella virus NE-JV-1]